MANWHLQQFNSATGSTNLTNDGYIKVNITQASSQNWHLALRQNGLLLEQGKAYEVKYKVYADNPRSFNTIMSKKDGTQYHYQSGLASTTPENHSFQFAMTAPSDSDAIINFNLGADISSTYLDSISIIELNCDPCSNSLYLLNQNIYPRSYQVAQLLESNGLVKNGDTVNFRANEIQMSLFTANNDPCQN